jgi:hypothetical protein
MALLARESVCLDVLRRGTRAAVLRMQLNKMHDAACLFWGGSLPAQCGGQNSRCFCAAPEPTPEKKSTAGASFACFWGGSLNSREIFCGDAVRAPGRWAVSAAGTALEGLPHKLLPWCNGYKIISSGRFLFTAIQLHLITSTLLIQGYSNNQL